ncbi:DUF4232 domain-containing protein [Kitasatospora herbaricolor]|uniref:DUF4232 domain-containing protein n=1 Tax=Kitasatospora herbaricolor TaxID=68217 RepID=UPI0036D809F3
MTTTPDTRRPGRLRRLAPLLAAGALLTACGSTPATAPAAAPGGTDCPDPGVTITAGPANAAMGLRVLTIDMVNCGIHRYTVTGYPAVRVLDDQHRPLGVTVESGSSAYGAVGGLDATPVQVTLLPGERATSLLAWRNTLVGPVLPTPLTAGTGTHLAISPTADRPPQTVTPGHPLDFGDAVAPAVAPWTRATR